MSLGLIPGNQGVLALRYLVLVVWDTRMTSGRSHLVLPSMLRTVNKSLTRVPYKATVCILRRVYGEGAGLASREAETGARSRFVWSPSVTLSPVHLGNTYYHQDIEPLPRHKATMCRALTNDAFGVASTNSLPYVWLYYYIFFLSQKWP